MKHQNYILVYIFFDVVYIVQHIKCNLLRCLTQVGEVQYLTVFRHKCHSFTSKTLLRKFLHLFQSNLSTKISLVFLLKFPIFSLSFMSFTSCLRLLPPLLIISVLLHFVNNMLRKAVAKEEGANPLKILQFKLNIRFNIR